MTDTDRQQILAHLRAAGCRCEPEIKPEGPIRAGTLTNVHVYHDEGCPLLRRSKAGLI